jgi:tetratricopeptide (TPR) repeat protein
MAEKSLNEISREARALYTKGTEALSRENVDYAIALFNQALEKEPGFYDCRRVLREAQFRKAGARKGFLKKMWSRTGSSPLVAKIKMSELSKNHAEILSIAEEILNDDPYNSVAHRAIVDAGTALELPRTVALSYETLALNSPKDRDLAIEFARAVSAIGEGSRAEKILMDLQREMPNDGELNTALKDLSARKTMDEGGYSKLEGGGGSYRDILKDKVESASLEQEKRVQKTQDATDRLIEEYEERAKNEPNNLKLVRSLAEMYTQKKDFDRALGLYERIKKSEMGNDPSLERAISITISKRFDYQLEQVNPFDADSAAQTEKIKAEKLAFQVADCQKRVENYPTDLALRFEMGVLYFQSDNIGEAIKEFQKARGNPHKRLSAMSYLAQCFAKRKMFDLAATTLQDAIKEKPVFDDEKKDLVYNLGSVLESMGKKEEAIEQYKQIYQTDASYKDVSQKVESFYSGQ